MNHFFQVYKSLENKKTYVLDVGDRKKAEDLIRIAMNRYDEEFDQ